MQLPRYWIKFEILANTKAWLPSIGPHQQPNVRKSMEKLIPVAHQRPAFPYQTGNTRLSIVYGLGKHGRTTTVITDSVFKKFFSKKLSLSDTSQAGARQGIDNAGKLSKAQT